MSHEIRKRSSQTFSYFQRLLNCPKSSLDPIDQSQSSDYYGIAGVHVPPAGRRASFLRSCVVRTIGWHFMRSASSRKDHRVRLDSPFGRNMGFGVTQRGKEVVRGFVN